ncbi:MAG: MT-A70 family methyltransferase [Sphingomonadaceae bacterium]
MDWPFEGLTPGRYGLILADPPWSFRVRTEAGTGRSPQRHYPCLSMAELIALPVAGLAARDSALLMWATAPMLPDALKLMGAWGFAFKSAGAWAKQSASGASWAFGTGYCFRSAAEFFLLGTRGRPVVQSRRVRNLVVAPVREHSRKPDQLHAMAEALYAGPYLELFARQRRPGWDAWGNDPDHFEAAA